MNLKKTFYRIKLVLVNILKQVLSQFLTVVLSVFIIKLYSTELWGEFSTYFLYVNLMVIVVNWGNKEFLIREFSKLPGKITENFYRLFNTRLILLAFAIGTALFVLPVKWFGFFSLWIISLYISQSLEVFWIYKRDYIISIVIEILSFSMFFLLLFYNKMSVGPLIEFYSYYQLLRTILYVLIYYPDLKKIHFGVDKKYFVTASSFFLLSLVGFLQSRIDFVIITFFESVKNIAVYQIITAFFILIHALGTFLIFPYMKNIYRLERSSINAFQKFISLISPLVVMFSLCVLFLITKYIYKFDLDFHYYLLGFAITFPPYLYTVKILILFKENKQDFVLKTGIIAIVINSAISLLLLYFGYGLKGALIGSAIAQFFTAYQYLTHFLISQKRNSDAA
jgi:hypothetical protein